MSEIDQSYLNLVQVKNQLEDLLYKSTHLIKEQVSVLIGPAQTNKVLGEIQAQQNLYEQTSAQSTANFNQEAVLYQ